MNDLLLTKRVLIAEDEPIVAMMIADFIQALGCRDFIALDTEDDVMLELAGSVPNFAIVDLTLRGHDRPNFAVADTLGKMGVPFIFTSAAASCRPGIVNGPFWASHLILTILPWLYSRASLRAIDPEAR